MTIQRSEAMEVLTQTINKANGSNPDLVAVMGGEPEEMFRRAISELGGMKQFVKPGQKVVVKPNIGWDKVPELAGNTNPKLIEEIVRQCFAAGAKEVVVFDHTCDDWQKCYKNSGIEAAAKKAGAKVMPAHLESYYKPIDLPKGKKMKKAKVHEAILDCDVWINVPILKNHGGANLTISMKNHMGIVWDRGFFHQNDLQQCIADICTLQKKAVLNVVDAYRIMKTNGPRGRSASDVVLAKTDVGSKGSRLALTKSRMSEQQMTFKKLKSTNEDKELSDIIIDYTAAYNAYQASMQAASKAIKQTLLDYI